MKVFNSLQLINELIQITESNQDLVKKKCFYLNENQLNWRHSHGSWNILEILAHLNDYANYYQPIIKDKLSKTSHNDFKETFVSSPLGRSAWKSMKLGRANNVKRKFKAPKNTNPTLEPSLVKGDDVQQFMTNQKDLIELLENVKNFNLRKIKVPIAISRLVRLRLGDALMFHIYHNERHIQQVTNILIHPKFPKK